MVTSVTLCLMSQYASLQLQYLYPAFTKPGVHRVEYSDRRDRWRSKGKGIHRCFPFKLDSYFHQAAVWPRVLVLYTHRKSVMWTCILYIYTIRAEIEITNCHHSGLSIIICVLWIVIAAQSFPAAAVRSKLDCRTRFYSPAIHLHRTSVQHYLLTVILFFKPFYIYLSTIVSLKKKKFLQNT